MSAADVENIADVPVIITSIIEATTRANLIPSSTLPAVPTSILSPIRQPPDKEADSQGHYCTSLISEIRSAMPLVPVLAMTAAR
jgi:hypothetical protein